eukprot:gene18342-46309_t
MGLARSGFGLGQAPALLVGGAGGWAGGTRDGRRLDAGVGAYGWGGAASTPVWA